MTSLPSETDAGRRLPSGSAAGAATGDGGLRTVRLSINGRTHTLRLEPRATLLDTLRDELGLTGTKKGCDRGQCGACTVLIDGRRVLSCLSLAIMQQDREVTTIEGLAQGERLHPMQRAFVAHDALQCGFCTPGQICSAIGMLREAGDGMASIVDPAWQGRSASLSDAEIRERMSGNLCRCGAYRQIVAAIQEVALADGGQIHHKFDNRPDSKGDSSHGAAPASRT